MKALPHLYGVLCHGPKGAAMALFARVCMMLSAVCRRLAADRCLAFGVSMFLGAIAAIGQTNIKRLMAYSSIAHMGYALMGLRLARPWVCRRC